MADLMTLRRKIIASQPHLVTTSGQNFNVNIGEPKIEKMEVSFTPVQSGSGVASPTNVRPISGYNSVGVTIGANTFSKSLGATYYGGTVDLVSGVLTATYVLFKISDSTPVRGNTAGNFLYINLNNIIPFKHSTSSPHPDGFCDKLELVANRPRTRTTSGLGEYDAGKYYSYVYVWDIAYLYPSATTLATASAALKELDPTWVFELETPQTYQLSQQEIQALRGQQTVTSTAGNVSLTYWAK